MPIQIGDPIPSVMLKRLGSEGLEEIDTAEYFKGKHAVLFGLPGAYTPTCTQKHLPGYVARADAIKLKGVDEIICVAVNDPFVMHQWGKTAKADGKVTMLPDGNGDFAKSLGLELDGIAFGMGQRMQRFVMILDDGVVKGLEQESNSDALTIADADSCIRSLAKFEIK